MRHAASLYWTVLFFFNKMHYVKNIKKNQEIWGALNKKNLRRQGLEGKKKEKELNRKLKIEIQWYQLICVKLITTLFSIVNGEKKRN